MAYVIGICGPAGGGKTTLIHSLLKSLEGATAIYIDDYQRITREPISKINQWRERGGNFDEFSVPLLGDHLRRLKAGEHVIDPLSMKRIEARDYILFETHFGRAHEDTGQYIDLLVWIETPEDIALSRNVRDLLSPMLPGGGVIPDQQRIAAIDSYLRKYVTEIRPLRAFQAELLRDAADIRVDGSAEPEAIAEKVKADIVAALQ